MLAPLGYVTLVAAVIADMGVSLLVTLNGLRLMRMTTDQDTDATAPLSSEQGTDATIPSCTEGCCSSTQPSGVGTHTR